MVSDTLQVTPQQQRVLAQIRQLESERISLLSKIGDLEAEKREYKLVLDVFGTVDASRRCARMVGGVLVPRTVGEVKPALEASNEKILALLDKLNADLNRVVKAHADLSANLSSLGSMDGGETGPTAHAERPTAESKTTASEQRPNGAGGVLV